MEQPLWRAQMGKWRNPTMQHDVAEFLTHVLNRLPYTMNKLAIPWQARSSGQNWRVQDLGLLGTNGASKHVNRRVHLHCAGALFKI